MPSAFISKQSQRFKTCNEFEIGNDYEMNEKIYEKTLLLHANALN